MINYNLGIKLILSDVDETIADVYTDASPAMISQLSKILSSNVVIFLVTGAGLGSVKERITDHIAPELRHNIIVAHCSGAEVIGFNKLGELTDPYYSVYHEKMSEDQQMTWRNVVKQVVDEFSLELVSPQKVSDFINKFGKSPLTVMYADRGPQITLECVNGYKLNQDDYGKIKDKFPYLVKTNGVYDIRIPLAKRFDELLAQENLPVRAHLAGVFALDLILDGVSKTTAIQNILSNHELLKSYNLPLDIVKQPSLIEIWGDKFTKNGGSDRKMSMAVDPSVRSIDFRKESVDEIGDEYNIVLWDGKQELHDGLLEYLELSEKIT